MIQKTKSHRICKTNTKNRCEIKNIRISSLFNNVTAACVNTLRLKAKHIYKYTNIQIYTNIYIYIIELNNNPDIRQYSAKNWKKILDYCEILLNTYLIQPDDLLIILNSVNNDIQFSMEINDNSSLFWHSHNKIT